MTRDVRGVLDAAAKRLAAAGVESARADAETLLAEVLGTSKNQLWFTRPLTEDAASAYDALVARRAAREPLQHITGRAAFRYRELEVGTGVFVPRPETEVLAGAAIEELHRLATTGEKRLVAVDLCSGSGAVAVSMAAEVPGTSVTAVEVSAEAAAYAERNTAGLDVDVRCCDIADDLDDLAGVVSVVTANPPYIPLAAYESVAPEARQFDPPVALWSGVDGLDAIRVVARVAARLLADGGLVLCEHADVQGDTAPAVFAATGNYTAVRDCTDLTGRQRFVSARRIRRSSGAAGTITA